MKNIDILNCYWVNGDELRVDCNGQNNLKNLFFPKCNKKKDDDNGTGSHWIPA